MGRQPKLSVGQRAELVERYSQGETFGQLAADFGVCEQTARKAICTAGVALRGHGNHKLSPVLCAELAERYSSGASVRELATGYGVSTWLARKALRSEGVPLRGSRVTTRVAQLVEARRAGLSPSEIAERFNTSYVTGKPR